MARDPGPGMGGGKVRIHPKLRAKLAAAEAAEDAVAERMPAKAPGAGSPAAPPIRPATQDWLHGLSIMQQTVLLTAIRGPDGMPKYSASKMVLRWYRRCVLVSALDGCALMDPCNPGGGSFTGPSVDAFHVRSTRRAVLSAADPEVYRDYQADMQVPLQEAYDFVEAHGGWEPLMEPQVAAYLRELDAIPHHFQLHLLHAAEIVGFKHPSERHRTWWRAFYERLVHDMHLWPETEAQLDARLGDNREGWLARADAATVD